MEEYPEIADTIKQNVTHLYNFKIKKEVIKAKNQYIKKIANRKDFAEIMLIVPNLKESHVIAASTNSNDPGNEKMPGLSLKQKLKLIEDEEEVCSS
jgi:hypothetical protein